MSKLKRIILASLVCSVVAVASSSILLTRSHEHDVLDRENIGGSPLSPRGNASAFYIANNKVGIWGGEFAEEGERGHHADGAVYDIYSQEWSMLPEAPVSAENGHVSAVVSSGVLIAEVPKEGSGAAEGALLAEDGSEWTSVEDPPFTSEDVFTGGPVTVDGKAIISTEEKFYSYDAEYDRWKEGPTLSGRILRAIGPVQTGEGHSSDFWSLVESDTGMSLVSVSLSDLSPTHSTAVPRSDGVSEYATGSTGGSAYVFLWGEGGLNFMEYDPNQEGRGWREHHENRSSEHFAPFSTKFPDSGEVLPWGGGFAIYSAMGVVILDIETKEIEHLVSEADEAYPCGPGASVLPTDGGFFVWGGQNCIPESMGLTNTGALVDLTR